MAISTICSAKINVDSTYEYFSCTLIKMDIKKLKGYEYKIGEMCPIRVIFTYCTEKNDTIAATQFYKLHLFKNGELTKLGEINNSVIKEDNFFKNNYYKIGQKYYMKFRALSLFELFTNLSDVKNNSHCEYHISNWKQFRWRPSKKHPHIPSCKKNDFTYYIGDIDNAVVLLDVHDAKNPGSGMTGW